MSIFTDLALPTTLTDLLQARQDALRLLSDARRMTDMARELLERHGRYLMPHNGQLRDSAERVQAELDASMWRRAFDLTGFKQLMDAQAVAEFERSLTPRSPEFTEANIRSTFIDLHGKSREMFRRGVVNVFRHLSDDYKTNANEPFRIGRKLVMTYMTCKAFGGGLELHYGGARDKLNDIDRVVRTVGGMTFTAGALPAAVNQALKLSQAHECELYRAKGFQNGNLHFEFKRLDLLDLVNEQIAEHYANTLPDAR